MRDLQGRPGAVVITPARRPTASCSFCFLYQRVRTRVYSDACNTVTSSERDLEAGAVNFSARMKGENFRAIFAANSRVFVCEWEIQAVALRWRECKNEQSTSVQHRKGVNINYADDALMYLLP